ncbi:putative lyase [Janibacter sp. HTCC2649]|uniref:PLP-dependent cysteine synthase family protein n=1 Tax=Janibacter sp. HTCC2649 TaxID=313589 RepID=UPI0000671A41|nr:PLP-dependent cysteine synthase family protein [Janibacter sp. HTCC2649]EAP97934.1 putative lyase [Janibacter sp. HTCC2649]
MSSPTSPVPAPLVDTGLRTEPDRAWVRDAIRKLRADATRTSDTHLIKVHLPGCGRVDLYLKDESTHPTGSLKHRLARSLFLYGLCNGLIGPSTTVVEASSGSTAVSEAHFARMLGVPFVAVMASSTSPAKIKLIEREGGTCHLVDDPTTVYDEARRLADAAGGIYLDQFSNAERATDWRGNNNIAESIFEQMAMEEHPVPSWIVVGAGTGGTSATIGRFVRYQALDTQVCVVDPERSAFLPAWQRDGEARLEPSRIEGIGRARLEPSFLPLVVDRMLGVPDAASIAATRFLRERTGIHAGPSTGTNIYGALKLAAEMQSAGQRGSIVSLVCDRGDRYEDTYNNDAWVTEKGHDLEAYAAVLAAAWDDGTWIG